MGEEALVHVGDGNFDEEILKADKPVLVDFWAPWCGPCKALGPTVEALAEQYRDRLEVAKVNIDNNPKTAQAYGVMSIPTLILFKDGKPVKQVQGFQPEPKLRELIASA